MNEVPIGLIRSVPGLLSDGGTGAYAGSISGAVQLWGRTPDEGSAYGGAVRRYKPDGSLWPPEDSPMGQVLRTGQSIHDQELLIERPDGTRVVATVHIEPVMDKDGRVVGAISCFHETNELR